MYVFPFPCSALYRPLCYPPQVRPVYLTIPTNMVDQKILSAPLSTPLSRRAPPNDPSVEKFVLDEIAKLAKDAQREGEKDGIVILVDACAIRHHVRDEVKELCEKTGFPVYAAPMGKTVVSEEYERYGGVCTSPDILKAIYRRCLVRGFMIDLHRKHHGPGNQGENRECEIDLVHRVFEVRFQHRQFHLQHSCQ
jgi:hypothetical protein